jgi:type II secretory ATPase GspE/PulE/Tfp pilus assembly ATPase PilB-like protein
MTDHRIDTVKLVDDLLHKAIGQNASDLHLEPVKDGYEARIRVDGLLQTIASFDASTGGNAVSRLMVLAQLLTYRLDVPQEGRIEFESNALSRTLDLRLAIIPTVHGLRAAVRLPAELSQPRELQSLGLPTTALRGLEDFARTDSGMLIVTGPAGSGKTTTIYALLQYIASSQPGLSIVALEDPVERQIEGITQIEVKPFGEMTYERALRSILRQDPQVLMLGEIRDADTAKLAVQAALSGHRLICTLHAATPEGAIIRLMEMDIEPYRISGCLWGVLSQRLLRTTSSPSPGTPGEGRGEGSSSPTICANPEGTLTPALSHEYAGEGAMQTVTHSYRGRVPVAQWLRMTDDLRAAIVRRADASEIARLWAQGQDARTLQDTAAELIRAGITDAAEVNRVLGINV